MRGASGAGIIDGLLAPHPGGSARTWLFAPMGVGDHFDHLVVLHALIAHLPRVSERYELLFYEDPHCRREPVTG